MATLPLLFASLFFSVAQPATVQPASAAPSAPASLENPIPVDFMSVIDHPDVFGGQRVSVRTARVNAVVGPRLVVIGHPRRRGFDTTYEPAFPRDKLLVLLPPSIAVSPGRLIGVTGTVRTVASARAAGLPVEIDVKRRGKAAKDAGREIHFGNRIVLVADTVETADGNAIAGGER